MPFTPPRHDPNQGLLVVRNWDGIRDLQERGQVLAETSVADGGWKELLSAGRDPVTRREYDLTIKDDRLRADCALLLENGKEWMADWCRVKPADRAGTRYLTETTRSAQVGGLSEFMFPLIRASSPNNILYEIASVQVITRRTAAIMHWNWIVGRGKGDIPAGTRLFDSQTGVTHARSDLMSDRVVNEPITALAGANAAISGTLDKNDGGGIRPGTLRLSLTTTGSGVVVFTDNGNGSLVQSGGTAVTASVYSINYATGAWAITITGGETFSTATTNTATYRWDTEGSSKVVKIDVQTIVSTVEVERQSCIISTTLEAQYDAMAELGVSLEPQILKGASDEMGYETCRRGIELMWEAAGTPVLTFDKTPASDNYNQQDHFKDLVFALETVSNTILSRTQKGYGNFLIVDTAAASMIASLPAGMFQRAPQPANVNGPHYIGMLLGQYRVYRDIKLSGLTNASSNGNILMGYKGDEFWKAGLVFAPLHLLYGNDPVVYGNLVQERGLASRYAFKMVNPMMYARINLGA